MLEYRAEGLCRNANHLSREELSRCMASGEVLQSTALAYDTGHRLRFELGGLRGIMPFADCVDAAPGETVTVPAQVELPAVTLYPLLIGKEAFLAVQQDELQWALYGIPTTLLFWLVVAIFYVVRMRRAVRRAKVDTEGGAQPGGSAGG